MKNSTKATWLALGLSCALSFSSAGARAADATLEPDVAAAEAAYGQLSYEDAVRRAELLSKRKGMSHDQLVRVYRILAISRASLGEDEKAREAFVLLLTYEPDTTLDKSFGPKVQQPYQEARGYWRQQPSKPGLEATVSALRQGSTATLRATPRDPTHTVHDLVIAYRFGAKGAFEAKTLPGGAQSVDFTVPAGESRLDYYVQARDANESIVFEVGSAQAPKTALVEAKAVVDPGARGRTDTGSKSIFASPIFWIATGAVVAAGAVGTYFIATSGKTREEQLPPNRSGISPIIFCGAERCR